MEGGFDRPSWSYHANDPGGPEAQDHADAARNAAFHAKASIFVAQHEAPALDFPIICRRRRETTALVTKGHYGRGG